METQKETSEEGEKINFPLGVELKPIQRRFNNTDKTEYKDYEIINKEVKEDE